MTDVFSEHPRLSTASSCPPVPGRRAALTPAIAALLLGASVAQTTLAAAPSAAPPAGERVDNPFAGADFYRDLDWVDRVEREAARAPEALANAMLEASRHSPSLWIDGFEALEGSAASAGANAGAADAGPAPSKAPGERVHRGLEAHLLAALEQKRPGVPLAIGVVVYNLPERDCAARASNGSLHGKAGIESYRRDFIDPMARLFGDARFRELRIVAILEPDSLPNLVTNLDTPGCAEAAELYRGGIAYAIERFAASPNVYVYLDMGHSGWLGWPGNRRRSVALYRDVVGAAGALSSVAGVATNVSGYTPTEEPFLGEPTRRVGDREVRMASFYEYNPIFDERTFATELEAEFEAAGFPEGFGVLIDTSRNGWGGAERPRRTSASASLETYVDESRLDRRGARGHWCNQSGAGLGERPRAWPYGPGGAVDAFVWIKPPGESDGASSADIAAGGPADKGFDSNCDPSARGDGGLPTGALSGAPPAGHWFPAQFRMLVENAWPALRGSADAADPPMNGTLLRTLRTREAIGAHRDVAAGKDEGDRRGEGVREASSGD